MDSLAPDRICEVVAAELRAMSVLRGSPLRERTRGRWRGILAAQGIDPRYLTGKNGPCPLCPGGKDRWRFTDLNGDGYWIHPVRSRQWRRPAHAHHRLAV